MTERQTDRFGGVFSLLLTPFTERGEIDWNAYDSYVDWQLAQRPNGLFAVCGTSEMKWLSTEERMALAARAVKRSGDTPVVATANLGPNVRDHGTELQRMADTGVSGVILVPPPGTGEDQPALGEYFERLLESSPVPVFLYEWPQVHPYLIDPDVVAALSRKGLRGIKDTTCTMEGILAKMESAASGTIIYQANTPFLLDAIQAGATGIMAITSAACGDLVVRLWNTAMSGDDDAIRVHEQLVYLDAILRFAYPAVAKHIARLRGVPMGLTCRWPIQLTKESLRAAEVCHQALYGNR